MSTQINDITQIDDSPYDLLGGSPGNFPESRPETDKERQSFLRRTSRARLVVTGIAAGTVILAAIVTAAAALIGASPPVAAQISIKEVINKVDTDRPRGSIPMPETYLSAVVGQELLPGDGLRTYANSQARVDISIADYTRITRTKPNTVWRLGQFSLQEETIIELDQGKIFLFDAEADPTGRPFKVVTPAGTASPRGTWMSFAYDPVEKVAELQCFRGTCILENDFGTQVLKDEEKSFITLIAAPVEPVVMTIEESTEFEELPEATTGEITIPTPEPTPQPTPEPVRQPTVELITGPGTEPGTEPSTKPDSTQEPVSYTISVSIPPADEPASGSIPASNPDLGPDLVPEPDAAPIPSTTPVPVATPRATPRPAPRQSRWRMFNRAPTPTFVPTRWPTPTPTPDFQAMFGSAPASTQNPMGIQLPPVNTEVLPHIFVGTVSINSIPAADGVEVTIWTSGFSESLARSTVSGGTFTVLVPQYGFDSFNGRSLLFKVGDLVAKPAGSWVAGGADLMDLKVTLNGPGEWPTTEAEVR